MPSNYCLPKKLLASFVAATRAGGPLDVFKLQDMTTADRIQAISDVIGPEDAKQVNQLFEEKMLLKYKFGLFDWIDRVSDVSPQVRQNLVEKVQSLSHILSADDEKTFLGGLAEQRLGTAVTHEEAGQILELSNQAQQAKDAWAQTLDQNIPMKNGDYSNPVIQTRLDYGNALLDLRDKIEELKPQGSSYTNLLMNALSAPKTLATGILHFSAIGVQAWGMISNARTWEGFIQQFKYFGDEENYRQLESYIISHPDYQYAVDGHLGLTHVTDKLSDREEAIQSSLLQDANTWLAQKSGLPINVLGASSRAFTGFLNYTRFNRFSDLLNAARSVDESSVALGSQTVKDLAQVVNNFTGRANLDSTLVGLNEAQPDRFGGYNQVVLNSVFFAPRKMAATMQMFNPAEFARLYKNGYDTGNYTAANAAVRQLTGSLIATGSLLYLAKAMNYSVNFDPRSTDFAKIAMSNGEKLDVTGGNAIYLRLVSRMLTNTEITSKGKEIELGQGYKPTTRADLLQQYIRGKLSPVMGALTDALYGQNQIGQTFGTATDDWNAEGSRIEPIVGQSIMNYYMNQPNKAISDIPVLSGLFGVNVESPLPPLTKFGLTPGGVPEGTKTPVDDEMNRLGIYQNFPSQTINGVKLTSEQYKQYIQLSGQMANQIITPVIQNPGWAQVPKVNQVSTIKEYNTSAKTIAQGILMSKYPDIMRQSLELQRKKALGQ